MIHEGVTAIEVKASSADPYHAWLMSKMADTAWAVSNNYFTTSAGKIVTQSPFSTLDYGALLKTLGPLSESVRRRGTQHDEQHSHLFERAGVRDPRADEPLRYDDGDVALSSLGQSRNACSSGSRSASGSHRPRGRRGGGRAP